MMRKKEEPDMKFSEKLNIFMAAHWRGFLIVVTPLIFLPLIIPTDGPKWKWCAFTLLVIAVYWVTECLPLAVTGFLPIVVFPLAGVTSTENVTKAYINDSVFMFLGSLMLAYSVEQSGFHKRLAFFSIRTIGYSHKKLLLAMCCVTTFVSMWITNTAATTMMLPIVFAILRVFEAEGILRVYDKNSDGTNVASDITTCYFCTITYSATNGGIGTLVGTGTNLVFKSLFATNYPKATEYLSFPLFSAFGAPFMVLLEISTYFYMAIVYLGLFRKNSKVYESTKITDKGKKAVQATIESESKKLGNLTYWELMVVLLFGGAIIGFFCRSPQIFPGWADVINEYFGNTDAKFIKDSALAMVVCFAMFLLPNSLQILDNFKAKYYEDLPKTPIGTVLMWKKMDADMPYNFMFLLGGGIALSQAAKSSGLNDKLGEYLSVLAALPNSLILLLVIICVVFVTNLASNIAVANVFCPIAMTLAEKVKVNPLWYLIASGFSASFCFLIPVGTPGNLIVKNAASVTTMKMMVAGIGSTAACIVWGWFCFYFYAPLVWPDLNTYPSWAN